MEREVGREGLQEGEGGVGSDGGGDVEEPTKFEPTDS